MILARAKI
jgi:hypothetical protein